jgi:hypothetical protein
MTRSSVSRIKLIESWYRAHEDGQFCEYPSDPRSARTGDHSNARTVIYNTKNHCLPQIRGLTKFEAPIAAIGRYGLPSNHDLPLIQGSSTVINRIFVGDADPPDILVFSWLREYVPIRWHGVNDEFLVRHGNRDYDGIRIRLSDAERETVRKLPQFCPDFRELLGEYCSSLLDDGFKIELEGAIIDRAAEAHT